MQLECQGPGATAQVNSQETTQVAILCQRPERHGRSWNISIFTTGRNPGHLPNNLTVEKIRSGISNIRNPILVSYAAKGLLPYKGLGSGIKRALEDWPDISFTDDREGSMFIATVHRKELEGLGSSEKDSQKSIQKVPRKVPRKSSNSCRMIRQSPSQSLRSA